MSEAPNAPGHSDTDEIPTKGNKFSGVCACEPLCARHVRSFLSGRVVSIGEVHYAVLAVFGFQGMWVPPCNPQAKAAGRYPASLFPLVTLSLLCRCVPRARMFFLQICVFHSLRVRLRACFVVACFALRGASACVVVWIPVVLRPAARSDITPVCRVAGASLCGDMIKRQVEQL